MIKVGRIISIRESFEVPGARRIQMLLSMKAHRSRIACLTKKGTKKFLGVIELKEILRRPEESQILLLISRDYPVLSSSQSILDAVKAMVEEEVWDIPVVDNGEYRGIVRACDIVRYLTPKMPKKRVGDFTRSSMVGIWHRTPLNVTVKTLLMAGEEVALVLDDEGEIRGGVHLLDLASEGEELTVEKTSSLSTGSEDQSWDWSTETRVLISKRIYVFPRIPVAQYVRQVMKVYENSLLKSVAIKLSKDKMGWCIVENAKGSVIGMVSILDVLSTFKKSVL